ncbi:MAG: hypothetical protein DRI37_07660 [Chloroflexi bacterium]|nr:MAG: hypothetical protein DRI37_07660 [Chloroflexota bacterium]
MEPLGPILLTLGELLAVLALLLLADHWLHQHLQGIMFLLTGDAELALWLYALVLFPGVLIHESSHALVAKILGVRIGRMGIFPRRVGRRIQLGFVPVEETDFLRASLIGAAPLLAGSAVILVLGHYVFGTPEVLAALSAGEWLSALRGLGAALQAPDAWIWAYLVFAVGNTMLPSRSDVHAWPFLGAALVIIAGVMLLAGAGALLLQGIADFLGWAARWVVLLGGCTFLVDLPFFLLLFLLEKGLERWKGQQIVYR